VPRAATLRSLADIAEDQWGLFTRRQAEATGMAWTTLARMAKNGVVERIAHGVYRLRGTPSVENLALRAAWLQLAPDTPVWERTAESGVVCRWSAATIYGLARGSANAFEFTLPVRRQTRRADVKLYRAVLADIGWVRLGGLLVATPGRIVADLLEDGEDLALAGQLVADALHEAKASERDVAEAIAPHAAAFGLAAHDGLSLLGWLCRMAPDRLAPSSPSGMDSGQREAAAAGQQFLPLQPKIERRNADGSTTVRITTVLRRGVRHDGTGRRQHIGPT